jgi:hypothetical protein
MKQFVPLRDDEFYAMLAAAQRPVPYRPGVPCHHALGAVGSEDSQQMPAVPADQRWNSTLSPVLTPSLSAMPALSSSTYLAGPLLG